jgi:integrase
MGHKRIAGLRKVGNVWHIQKRVRGFGTLRESTQEDTLEGAEKYLIHRLDQIRQQTVYGMRPARFFADAAAKFIEEDETAGADDNAAWLKQAMPYVGKLRLEAVHDGTLKPFIDWCRARGNKSKSINNKLGVVRRVLNLAARRWRDPATGMTWLETPPLITMLTKDDAREPYPISWKEQAVLFPLLPAHLQPMALFMVHTGLRDEECCGLRWDWEREVEELKVSVFVIPKDVAKNGEERVVMLNAVAQRVIEAQRGRNADWVFPYRGRRVEMMNNTGWQRARREAAAKYPEVFKRKAPEGFRTLHVHDLRHTFGRRLRAAGVSKETRSALLGHRTGDITTHYSAAELLELYRAVVLIESGASGPLLQAVQKPCNPEMTTGYQTAVSR